jgi:hypothetical protein
MKKPLSSIEVFLEKVFKRISSNTGISELHLGCYRIFFSTIFLVYFRPSYSWLGDVPQGFFLPKVLSISNLFSGFPSSLYFLLTDYLIIGLLVLTIIGVYARLAFFLLFFISIINNGFAYSLGKIDHYILVSLVFLVFAVTNSSTNFALRPDTKSRLHSFALAVFGIAIVFGYFTAGLQKAYHWIDFNTNTSGTLRWIYDIYFTSETKPLFADFLIATDPLILEGMDYFGVLFEMLGLVFLIYSKKSWKFYLLIASFFHLTNALVLNIPFTFHFPIFGIWLLSEVLFKYRYLSVLFGFGILLKGIYIDLYLWLFSILLSIYSLFKKS